MAAAGDTAGVLMIDRPLVSCSHCRSLKNQPVAEGVAL